MASEDMRELGSTGLKRQGGVLYEEYLPELTGSRWLAVVREMVNHPILSAMLFAVEMQIRRTVWQTKAADDSAEARRWADFVDECFEDMSFTWADTLSEILTMLPYGFAPLEIVYKLRGGESWSPRRNSRHSDGLIGWRKWSIRAQDTISEWNFDETGGIRGLVQFDHYAGKHREVAIPIEKLLLFRTTSNKNSPEGMSILRKVYRAWYFAKKLENIQAVFYERLNGIPLARVPAQLLSASATAAQQLILEDMKEIVANLRIDEQAGVILPSERDENGNLLYELDLIRADVGAGYDIEATIVRNEQRMLMAIMADFILMGHDSVGSFASTQSHVDMFWIGVDAWLDSITDIINRHAISRLMKLNGVDYHLWPYLVHGSVEKIDLDALGQYIVRMASSGIDVAGNEDVRTFLYQQANMPVNQVPGIAKPPVAGQQPAVDATRERNNGTMTGKNAA